MEDYTNNSRNYMTSYYILINGQLHQVKPFKFKKMLECLMMILKDIDVIITNTSLILT